MYNYSYYFHSFAPCFENVPSLLYYLYKSCRSWSHGPLSGGPGVLCLSGLMGRVVGARPKLLSARGI